MQETHIIYKNITLPTQLKKEKNGGNTYINLQLLYFTDKILTNLCALHFLVMLNTFLLN